MKLPTVEILPAESHALEMPAGTPLGLGILGAARFSAIRRVLEQAARAANAKAQLHAAEGAVSNALVNREVARERLRRVDEICQEAGDQITDGVKIARMRRKLEIMKMEDDVAEAEARRAGAKTNKAAVEDVAKPTAAKDDVAEFIDQIGRLPQIVQAVEKAKAQLIADAGGQDKLSEAQLQVCEMFDAMTQAFLSKKAGDAAL
ncbi:MAG TPA: hypothetical protein VMF58_12295 [Rhizomicrobium sp.]|nr:hypothetical protein [Rhizomicrobium sp.]